MDENKAKPSYYAVIPASVRYDDSIPANAKLLYGEISALISKDGFCYASNQFFAEAYGFSEDTVSRLISKLETAGYIVREIERDNSGQIIRRKLYLDVSTPEGHPLGFLSDTPRIKSREGIGQKVKETNSSNTNTPQSPPEGGGSSGKQRKRSSSYKAQADILPDRFNGFWDFYRTHIPPERNAGNRQAAIRAWDKLAPSDELVTTMAGALAVQVKSQAWLSGIGVPHASTWINNHGWEDDWGPAAEVTPDTVEGSFSEEAAEWVH